MVEVTFTGKCSGCPKFEAKVEKLYSLMGPTNTFVMCENQDLCEHIERHLKEKLNHGEEKG